MPEYLSPGVYVEEISTGSRPIEGVSTSTTGFVGLTERGPTAPRLVTSWLDYQRWYGGFLDTATSFLPFAVKGFFDNGGQRAFIARVTQSDAAVATLDLDSTEGAGQFLTVRAIGTGASGNHIYVGVSKGSRSGFRLRVRYFRTIPVDLAAATPDVEEDYDDLGLVPAGSRFVITTVNNASQLIELSWGDSDLDPARPDNIGFTPLANGSDGSIPMASTDFVGNSAAPPDQRTGLAGLETIDEISILTVPDEVHPALDSANQVLVRNEIISQCERLRDRFAVLQVPSGQGNVASISVNDTTSYAALYYPWVRVFNPLTLDSVLVPPGGHIAGIYARTDIERGVHKAPANEVVRGIITSDLAGNRRPLEYHITKGEHDILNPRGINAIRDFRADGRGLRVWGARTLSSDSQWRYINVRRLFIFIEESIDEGTQWVVFEPNYEPTWARVKRSITSFLTSVWRSGALAGTTQDEAFFVKCDRTTMSQDDIDNGRLICYIGVAPVKPAEFVIFRISQKTVEDGA